MLEILDSEAQDAGPTWRSGSSSPAAGRAQGWWPSTRRRGSGGHRRSVSTRQALGLSEVLQLLGMIASTLAGRHHQFHFLLAAPQKKTPSEFTACGNAWI